MHEAKQMELLMREYALYFLKAEYGESALKKFERFDIVAIDQYDDGGVSEVTDNTIKIAVRRDIEANRLTDTTKLIIRHELGHILDDSSSAFAEFKEEIEHERIAWKKAKPKTAAEQWYKSISIRQHLDPLKIQAMGFPRPERKVSPELLKKGIHFEVKRMKKRSRLVDLNLAKRFAMANLIENLNYYN